MGTFNLGNVVGLLKDKLPPAGKPYVLWAKPVSDDDPEIADLYIYTGVGDPADPANWVQLATYESLDAKEDKSNKVQDLSVPLSTTYPSTKAMSDALVGYPTNTRKITINNITQDLSADRAWTVGDVRTDVVYNNPAFINTLAWGKITGTPTDLAGYGITDVYIKPEINNFFSGVNPITGYNKTNWDTAYGWGNHSTVGYLETIEGIVAGGELSGTYASPTLVNDAVISKVLSGYNIASGSIGPTDSILIAFGKLQNQINGLIGGTVFKGIWDAAANNPTLQSGVGTNGWYYIVNTPGTTNLDGITDWNAGDWAIFSGTKWTKVDNTDAVISVNGKIGIVSLTTTDIPEGTNLYFTNGRAIGSVLTGFTSGAGTVSPTDTILSAIQKLDGNIALKAPISGGNNYIQNQTAVVQAASFNIQKGYTTYIEISTPVGGGAGGSSGIRLANFNNAYSWMDITGGATGEHLHLYYNENGTQTGNTANYRYRNNDLGTTHAPQPIVNWSVDNNQGGGFAADKKLFNWAYNYYADPLLSIFGDRSTAIYGTLRLINTASDPAIYNGGLAYRTDLNKGRIGISGVWQNLATEAWANAAFTPITGSGNYIQNQFAALQTASFRVNGVGYMGSLQLAWQDNILPSGGTGEIVLTRNTAFNGTYRLSTQVGYGVQYWRTEDRSMSTHYILSPGGTLVDQEGNALGVNSQSLMFYVTKATLPATPVWSGWYDLSTNTVKTIQASSDITVSSTGVITATGQGAANTLNVIVVPYPLYFGGAYHANKLTYDADGSAIRFNSNKLATETWASGNFIQNQNVSAQVANFWINGKGTLQSLRAGDGNPITSFPLEVYGQSYNAGLPTMGQGFAFGWNRSGAEGESNLIWASNAGSVKNLSIEYYNGTSIVVVAKWFPNGDLNTKGAFITANGVITFSQVATDIDAVNYGLIPNVRYRGQYGWEAVTDDFVWYGSTGSGFKDIETFRIKKGGGIVLPNRASAPTAVSGGLYYLTSTNKGQIGISGVWQNLATETWASGNFIQNQTASAQTANFWINGTATLGKIYSGGSQTNYGGTGNGIQFANSLGLQCTNPGTGESLLFNYRNIFIAQRDNLANPVSNIGITGTDKANFEVYGGTANAFAVRHTASYDGAEYLVTNTGLVKLRSSAADLAVFSGGIFYRSDINKGRIGISGVYQNIATEAWSNGAYILNGGTTTLLSTAAIAMGAIGSKYFSFDTTEGHLFRLYPHSQAVATFGFFPIVGLGYGHNSWLPSNLSYMGMFVVKPNTGYNYGLKQGGFVVNYFADNDPTSPVSGEGGVHAFKAIINSSGAYVGDNHFGLYVSITEPVLQTGVHGIYGYYYTSNVAASLAATNYAIYAVNGLTYLGGNTQINANLTALDASLRDTSLRNTDVYGWFYTHGGPIDKLNVQGEGGYVSTDALGQTRMGLLKAPSDNPKIAAGNGTPISLGHLLTANLADVGGNPGWYIEDMNIGVNGEVSVLRNYLRMANLATAPAIVNGGLWYDTATNKAKVGIQGSYYDIITSNAIAGSFINNQGAVPQNALFYINSGIWAAKMSSSSSSLDTVIIQNTATLGMASINFMTDTGAFGGTIGYRNSGSAAPDADSFLLMTNGKRITISMDLANTTHFTFTPGGRFLMGTTVDNGVDKLQVNGGGIFKGAVTLSPSYVANTRGLLFYDQLSLLGSNTINVIHIEESNPNAQNVFTTSNLVFVRGGTYTYASNFLITSRGNIGIGNVTASTLGFTAANETVLIKNPSETAVLWTGWGTTSTTVHVTNNALDFGVAGSRIAIQADSTGAFASGTGYALYLKASGAATNYAIYAESGISYFADTVILGPKTADPAIYNGGLIYRSDLNKVRIGISGTWTNIATESWVTAGYIQIINPFATEQSGSFSVRESSRVGPGIRYPSDNGNLAANNNQYSVLPDLNTWTHKFIVTGAPPMLEIYNGNAAANVANPWGLAMTTRNSGNGGGGTAFLTSVIADGGGGFTLNTSLRYTSTTAYSLSAPFFTAFGATGNTQFGPLGTDVGARLQVRSALATSYFETSGRTQPIITMKNTASDGWSAMQFLDSGGNDIGGFGYINSGDLSAFSNSFTLYSRSKKIIFSTDAATANVIITLNGALLVNTVVDNGLSKIQVSGNILTSTLTVNGNPTNDSTAKFGSIEIQPYTLNNAWFGENVYYDGGNFRRRAAGFGHLFYFVQGEGQFRFANNGAAGSVITEFQTSVQLKMHYSGWVALGGQITTAVGSFTGASLYVTGTGINMYQPVLISNLGGTGTRMVVADALGNLSTLGIPGGGGGVSGSGAANQIAVWSSAAVIGGGATFAWNGTKMQLGDATTLGTATPVNIDLGATYSNNIYTNPKIYLYNSGANFYGLGVTSSQFEFIIWPFDSQNRFVFTGGVLVLPSQASYTGTTLNGILYYNTGTNKIITTLGAVFQNVATETWVQANAISLQSSVSVTQTGSAWINNSFYVGAYAGAVTAGRISISGGNSELSILDRNVTSWSEVPTTGQRWAIYGQAGMLRFWSGGDKIFMFPNGNMALGFNTDQGQTLQVNGDIRTAQSSATGFGSMKFGPTATGSGLTLNTTRYWEISVNGTVFKVALIN